MEKSTSTTKTIHTSNNKGKIYNVKSSRRHKEIAEKLAEDSSLTLKDAILEVGYSISTAESPTKITESKSWQQLMDEYLPDQLLQQKHQEGLDATKKEDKEQVPDYAVRKQYLDLAYKIKGKNIDTPTQNINLNVVSDEQIKRLLD